jgi:broad specificity phosphatase PhoE
MNYGIFEGKMKEIVRKDFSEFFTQRNKDKGCKVYTSFPQGESYRDVYKRVFDKIFHLLSNYENFIIVGHQTVNKVIRGVILNLPLEDIINNEYIKIDVPEHKEYSYLILSSSE